MMCVTKHFNESFKLVFFLINLECFFLLFLLSIKSVYVTIKQLMNTYFNAHVIHHC